MNDRPTPETDYEEEIDNGDTVPLFEFARRLERQRDEAREDAALWKWHWMAARKEVENLIKEGAK